MLILGLIVFLQSAPDAPSLHFFDLIAHEKSKKSLTLELVVEPFAPYATLTDENLAFSPEVRACLDGPFRELLLIAQEFDRQRALAIQQAAELQAKDEAGKAAPQAEPPAYDPFAEPEFAMTSTFSVSCRTIEGEQVSIENSVVRLGLSQNPGNVTVVKNKNQSWEVPFSVLGDDASFAVLLKRIASPGSGLMRHPKSDAYILDLYYQVTAVTGAKHRYDEKPVANSLRILRTLQHLQRKEQMGTTFCYTKDGEFKQYQSGQLYRMRDLVTRFQTMSLKAKNGTSVTEDLEAIIDQAPAEAPLLGLLARDYLNHGRTEDAYKLLKRLEPLIVNYPPTAALYQSIRDARESERTRMLAKRNHFQEAEGVRFEILSPTKGDYIGGELDVDYRFIGKKAPILQMDLLIDDEILQSATEPPFKLSCRPQKKSGSSDLEVTVWFKDSTFLRSVVPIRHIEIAEEETVQRISLRTVVTKGGKKFLTDLKQNQFQVSESSQACPLVEFRKDQEPLVIAVLVDTSGSMAGEKLYSAQFALSSFLSNLEPQDRATVYTFDNKVLKISQPTHDFDAIRPDLFTLRPQLTTSLHDAILVACDDLRDQQGSKVIIVLSDGNDSTSHTKAAGLSAMLAKTNVMVYPIILDRAGGMERRGAAYLDDLAAVSGSIVTELKSLRNLNSAFAQIYQELKSFYFMDFYSRQRNFEIAKIKINVKGSGSARYRQFFREEDFLAAAR